MKRPETCSHCKYFGANLSLWFCYKDDHVIMIEFPSRKVDNKCSLKTNSHGRDTD